MKFRVFVEETTGGWVYVEADTADEAYAQVTRMSLSEVREVGEWGSCGDHFNAFLNDTEEIHEPTVSDTLWT